MMERLTRIDSEGNVAGVRIEKGQYASTEMMMKRLFEYEEIGLTPDDIGAREYDIKLLQRQNKEFREEIYRLREQNTKIYYQLIDTEKECAKDKAKLGEIRILMDKQ